MASVKFLTGSYAQYVSLTQKSDDTLYFVDGQIFKGSMSYSDQIAVVSALPDTLVAGKVYVNTTDKSVTYYDGTTSTVAVPATVGTIGDSTPDNDLANVKAIKDFIKAQIAKIPAAKDYTIMLEDTTAGENELTKQILKQGESGKETEVGTISVPKLVMDTSVTENNMASTYKFIYGGVEVGKVNIPKDLVVTQDGSEIIRVDDDHPVSGLNNGVYLKLMIQNSINPVYIDVKDLGGNDGITPHIDSVTKHWLIGETDTGILAEGVDGKDGITYVPTIGTVTSGDTANVSVVVNDETSTAEFSFTVPKGKQGDKGIDGTNGIDGKTYSPVIGTVSSGDTASANVTLDSNTLTATFDFVIPKGDKGDKGDTINISAGDGIAISSANSVSLVTQDGSENVGGITSADYTKFADAVTKSNKNETAISAINNTRTGAVATAKSYADSLNTAMDARVQVLENSISGGGGSVTVDSELSNTSENPVQNKVIYTALEEKALRSLYSDTTINVGRKADTIVGEYSTAEGYKTTASAKYSHAEGNATTAQSSYSHAEGYNTTASGSCSHAEGNYTTTSASYCHAEGNATTASGVASHAEGDNTIASGKSSHAEGYISESTYDYAHAEGYGSKAYAKYSHAEGKFTTASGESSHAEGNNTIASNFAAHVCGKNNVAMINGGTDANTTGTAFVIGNGTSVSVLSNAFSVQYDGTVKAKSTITASTTADYAEFFEWLDGNPDGEDRVGYFVTLDGDKIRIATDNDYILGIVSGEPFVLGNGDCDTWNGMFLRDEFRRTIYEPAPKIEEILDDEGNPTGEFKEIKGAYEGTRPKLNPEYDHTKTYISRFDRPEWAPVGMLGVLAVRHDGTARVNGYVTVNSDGIATACEKNNTNAYRVIKSNSDSVVEVIFK